MATLMFILVYLALVFIFYEVFKLILFPWIRFQEPQDGIQRLYDLPAMIAGALVGSAHGLLTVILICIAWSIAERILFPIIDFKEPKGMTWETLWFLPALVTGSFLVNIF